MVMWEHECAYDDLNSSTVLYLKVSYDCEFKLSEYGSKCHAE